MIRYDHRWKARSNTPAQITPKAEARVHPLTIVIMIALLLTILLKIL